MTSLRSLVSSGINDAFVLDTSPEAQNIRCQQRFHSDHVEQHCLSLRGISKNELQNIFTSKAVRFEKACLIGVCRSLRTYYIYVRFSNLIENIFFLISFS